ncbi:histidine kinase dimerization/phospho-acceptor domain-containing protein [Streptomyces sp. NPDC002082]|uniref:histidine kinase dimerization/phospho-acceptor domain-containing protein n=1 Tax=Streptomyces sp. NPDC002082 TaxID=3154772 RepID=UPI003318958C
MTTTTLLPKVECWSESWVWVARRLIEGNQIRRALLATVSHDLRTPLASIKASVTSLRSTDADWSDEDRADLLARRGAGTARSCSRDPPRGSRARGRRPGARPPAWPHPSPTQRPPRG